MVAKEALIRLSAPSPIPLRETGEGLCGCSELNDYRLLPFAFWQMGEGADRRMRALSSRMRWPGLRRGDGLV